MEDFTRVDIFDTKGVEYLFVIGYLLVLILFWSLARNPGNVLGRVKAVIGNLSAGILRIPQGIFFNRNHTWTHLGESGLAKVGLDDFLQHILGSVQFTLYRNPGEAVSKGDLLAEIRQDTKLLRVYSPISGEVRESNSALLKDPGILNQDPYDKGWIYRIKPSNWVGETGSCLLAEKARDWTVNELTRFKDFLSGGPMRKFSTEPSMILLQDGGEIRENVLSDLPEEVWRDFQKEFLNP
jgi:glycine cleavage system H protein